MQVNRAIVETLLYSDIFDFPLKKEEIWFYLISEEKVPYADFLKALGSKQDYSFKDGYYFIPGRDEIVDRRIGKEAHSKRQIELAKKKP